MRKRWHYERRVRWEDLEFHFDCADFDIVECRAEPADTPHFVATDAVGEYKEYEEFLTYEIERMTHELNRLHATTAELQPAATLDSDEA